MNKDLNIGNTILYDNIWIGVILEINNDYCLLHNIIDKTSNKIINKQVVFRNKCILYNSTKKKYKLVCISDSLRKSMTIPELCLINVTIKNWFSDYSSENNFHSINEISKQRNYFLEVKPFIKTNV